MMMKSIATGAVMAALAAGTVGAQTTGATGTGTTNNTGTNLSVGGQVDTNTRTGTGMGTGTNSGMGTGANTGMGTGTDTRTPAVATPDSRNPSAPVAGRNSFTQSQVMTRLSRAGYTNIGNLQKGSDGIWRGTGMKDGTTHNLMFDYQGNISTGAR